MSDSEELADSFGYKVVTTVTALAAGWLAQKVLVAGWKALSGDAPHDPDDEAASIVGVVGFAAATGAVAALARTAATRGVRKAAARAAARRR